VSANSNGGMLDTSLRARWKRRRRFIIPVIAVLAAVSAFATWGPIGIGPGPIGDTNDASTVSGLVSRSQPSVFVASIDAGNSGAVIDSIAMVSDGSFPAPHIISIKGDGDQVCGGTWPAELLCILHGRRAGPAHRQAGASQLARQRAGSRPDRLSGYRRGHRSRTSGQGGLLGGHHTCDPLPRRDQALHRHTGCQSDGLLEQVPARRAPLAG